MFKLAKHILVIRISSMGDVAMTVPVIVALISQNPGLTITVLTTGFFSPFFEHLKNVSVFKIDVKGRHKGISGLYKLSKELKRINIDFVADLHNVLRSNILIFFLRIPFIQIDKGRAEKYQLTSGHVFNQLKSTHERYADVFRKLEFKVDLANPVFFKKRQLNQKTLALFSYSKTKKIGIAPFAKYESKMYPLDLMEKVIEFLSNDFEIYLFGGGKTEVEILNRLEKRFNHVTNLAGKLFLKEELDVVSNLDVMLSMDSGNAHIAAMLGIPTITIWGVTHPYAGFAPFHQPSENTILSDRIQFPKIPTSIYGNKYPNGYLEVSRTIVPELVVNKVMCALSFKKNAM